MGLVTPTEPVPLDELGRVHFVGIGGAGMSGIARIMLARGTKVSGSDSGASAALDELTALGARVHVGHAAGQVGDADTLVVSSAIRDTNPELAEARRRGLRVLHRAAALASLMSGRRVVAVTGTHGKTTTTSMIATVLLEIGAGPAYAIGGLLAATGTGAADGPGRDFVAEADESDGSFLMYAPDVAVVTNIEADHLDNYGTEQAYRASFGNFLAKIKPGGLLVTSADDPGARDLAAQAGALELRVVTFGESADADYRVTRVTASGMESTLSVAVGKAHPSSRTEFELRLGVPGRHNALNAGAAFAAAVELGIEPGRAAGALASFRGAARRLEPKGEAGGVRVLDTYAHHPTELAADLRAAREITGGVGRVIAVFQPHLYSRTRIFAAEFGAALGLADEVVVLDVYAAREDPEPGVTGRLIADAVPGGAAHFVAEFADVPKLVAALAAPGDLVLTMGAGDITRMGPLVLAEIADPAPAPRLVGGRKPMTDMPPPAASPAAAQAAGASRAPGATSAAAPVGLAFEEPLGAARGRTARGRAGRGPGAASRRRGRRPRTRWRVAFFALAGVAVVGGVGWALLGDRLLVVRSVTVTGTHVLAPGQVIAAADVPLGTPLLSVDAGTVTRRVEAIPLVAGATVTEDWPDHLVIAVTERVPAMAIRMADGGYDLVDPSGVLVRWTKARPAALPVFVTSAAGSALALRGNQEVVAAAGVLAELQPWLARQVAQVSAAPVAAGPDQVTLDLLDGKTVQWGSPGNAAQKNRELSILLPGQVHEVDVSTPGTAVTK